MTNADSDVHERVARELAEVGTSALGLAPFVDLVFTARPVDTGDAMLLSAELVTGAAHMTTLNLSTALTVRGRPPSALDVLQVACAVGDAITEAVTNLTTAQDLLRPPPESGTAPAP